MSVQEKKLHTAEVLAAVKEAVEVVQAPLRRAREAIRPFEIVDDPMFLPSARVHNELARIEKILLNDLPELVHEMEAAYGVWLQAQSKDKNNV